MADEPPDIRATIRAGSVYKFPESTFSSTESHFFIVLNHDPLSDPFIALVCASSKIEKVRRRRSHLPQETLVRINPDRYADFTLPSIVDGNQVYQRSIGELELKIRRGQLEIKADMDMVFVRRLREAVKCSPMVEEEVKDLFLSC
ncbi:MAG: hypothetical protein ACOZF2_10635 [Thermodesulfobacteriota bacterium]